MDHPFKNKHVQTEKDRHSLLANTGGIVGPILITSFGTTKNPDYATPLYIIAGLMLVSAALPLVARVRARRRGDVAEVTTSSVEPAR